MKYFITIILVFAFVSVSSAQDEKYVKAMKKNIEKIDSLRDAKSMLDAANAFERIGLAEKDKWLPFYYASMLQTLASFLDSVNSQKDIYLDRAQKFIDTADSLQPDESEIYVIKGMIGQARMQIDPMNRYMKYGAESNANLQKATELDPGNPRPEYLMGTMTYYTPVQFGGGAQAAKPIFESSLEKFNNFTPDNELMPVWGKENIEQMLNQINQELESASGDNK